MFLRRGNDTVYYDDHFSEATNDKVFGCEKNHSFGGYGAPHRLASYWSRIGYPPGSVREEGGWEVAQIG